MPILAKALWTWSGNGYGALVTGFGGQPTKTGVLPSDLRAFAGVPLQTYAYRAAPVPLTDAQLLIRIRAAEDYIETQTGVLLTPTWISSAPITDPVQTQAAGLQTTSLDGVMRRGVDYDKSDTAYDFRRERAEDEGWMATQLRYRPLRDVDDSGYGLKSFLFVYPLLNTYEKIPQSWFVEDKDFSTVRLVPSSNIAMLPLIGLQLKFFGSNGVLPGGLNLQYTAGLTALDYQSQFAFMRDLVLSQAAIYALSSVQGGINQGMESISTLTDGVQTNFKYRPGGAYSDLVGQFTKQRDDLMGVAQWLVGGPVMDTL